MTYMNILATVSKAVKAAQLDSPSADVHVLRSAMKLILEVMNSEAFKTKKTPTKLLITSLVSGCVGALIKSQVGRPAAAILYDEEHSTGKASDQLSEFNPSRMCPEMLAVSNRAVSIYFALKEISRPDYLTAIQSELALPISGVRGAKMPATFYTSIESHRQSVFFGCLEELFGDLPSTVDYPEARELLARLTEQGQCIRKYVLMS